MNQTPYKMATNGKKSKSVRSEAMEVLSRLNGQCKQEAVEKGEIIPPCPAAKHHSVRVTAVKHISTENKEKRGRKYPRNGNYSEI
jgi:hypothetical protein